jgi:hypothetical protein
VHHLIAFSQFPLRSRSSRNAGTSIHARAGLRAGACGSLRLKERTELPRYAAAHWTQGSTASPQQREIGCGYLSRFPLRSGLYVGGACRDRTGDLRNAILASASTPVQRGWTSRLFPRGYWRRVRSGKRQIDVSSRNGVVPV